MRGQSGSAMTEGDPERNLGAVLVSVLEAVLESFRFESDRGLNIDRAGDEPDHFGMSGLNVHNNKWSRVHDFASQDGKKSTWEFLDSVCCCFLYRTI